MGKTKKRVSVLVLVAAALMMFSVAALADTVQQFSYTYNSQTLNSGVVTKSNNNTEAKATSLARGNGITSNVFSNGGTIAAYSVLSTGSGGNSGRMTFTANGQTKYGSYSSPKNGSKYVLQTTISGCNFTSRAMYKSFSWLP